MDEVYKYWEDGKEKKLTQLLFCDLSTPKTDGSFSVYNDVREKLIRKGVLSEEIAFIHHANTEVRKKELFSMPLQEEIAKQVIPKRVDNNFFVLIFLFPIIIITLLYRYSK